MTEACECRCHQGQPYGMCVLIGGLLRDKETGEVAACFSCLQKKVIDRYFEEWSRP